MGDTHPLLLSNLVKQSTVLGPVLNNCSLDSFSQESFSYQFGSVEIKSSFFVDDISDPNAVKQRLPSVIRFWKTSTIRM